MAFRVAVAGLGPRGADWARTIQATPGLELAGLAEIDPGAGARAAANAPGVPIFAEPAALLDAERCDALVVATPPGDHDATARAAIDRGVAVLVEKPLTLELEPARALVAHAEAAGIPLLVAQNYRLMRAWRTVRRLVAEGRLGTVHQAVMQYYRPPHEMVASLVALDPKVLWGVGVHHVDALRTVLGRRVEGVLAEAFTSNGRAGPGGGPSLRALLCLEGGVRVTYVATYESSGHEYFGRGQEFYARLVGDRATLHCLNRWIVVCEGGKLPRPVRRGRRAVTEEVHLLRRLADAIASGDAGEFSGRDNLQTMAAMEACVRSSREGRWIDAQALLADG